MSPMLLCSPTPTSPSASVSSMHPLIVPPNPLPTPVQALNHAETVRLLASIELAAYACKQAMADPALHSAIRRRIARVIKDDRRRRHKRRKDQDSMVAAFARTGLVEETDAAPTGAPSAYAPTFPTAASAPLPAEPVPVPAPIPMPIPNPAPAQASGGLFGGMQTGL